MINWGKIKKEGKYHNQKVVVDGYKFDSKKESNYYLYLKTLRASGKIRALELQPRYELQPGFRGPDGTWQRAITYVGDFRYLDMDDNVVVVDVKSRVTEANPVYRLKRKLLQYKYPHIKFVEVI